MSKINLNTKVQGAAGSSVSNNISKLIEVYKNKLFKAYYTEISLILRSPELHSIFINRVIDILFKMQGEYWGDSLVSEQDKTNVANERYLNAVKVEVTQNFNAAAASLNQETGEFYLTILSNNFIGIGKEGDKTGTAPIQWLVHFLIGNLENDLYWVNQELYSIFRGGEESGALGRFGNGYLWQMSRKEISLRNNQLKSAGYSFTMADFKHPQSGKSGKNWFEGILTQADIMTLIQTPALVRAKQRVGNLAL